LAGKLALALDMEDTTEALSLIEELKGEKIIIKIGYLLFIKGGSTFVQKIKEMGFEVFLDLKLHDIPNTVFNGVRSAVEIGADYLTIHTLGGKQMLEKAVEASEGSSLKLLGVTLLTSHGEEYTDYLGSKYNLDELAQNMAKTAVETGIHGIVCSPYEVKKIKQTVGREIIATTPGIRLPENKKGDQKRVATPEFAVKEGADIIVVGRPIINAKDRKKMVREFVKKIQNA